jgi:hypothetical protein
MFSELFDRDKAPLQRIRQQNGIWNSQKGRPNIKREILPIRTGHGTGDSFCNPVCLGSDISHYPPSTRTAPAVLQKPSSTTVSFVLLLAPSRIPRPSSETTSGTTANSRDPHFEALTSCLQCHFSQLNCSITSHSIGS